MSRKSKRYVNIIRPFLIGNMGLIVLAVVFWLYPVMANWVNARQIIDHQRQVYAIYRMHALQQHDDLQLESPPGRILYYQYLAAAMADVYSLARYYGLGVVHFDSAEWVDHDNFLDGSHIVERRVSAVFSGTSHHVAEFVYGLADSAAFIRTMYIEFLGYEMATLRVEFSLFGRGE